MDLMEKILNRGVAEIIEKNHLEKVLRDGKKLRVKLGIDPTSPELHLGHTVVLRKLRQFQDAGHKAILIIGDFTAQIGDPSGRDKTRPTLSEKEIKNNLKNYLGLTGKVIDIKKAEVRYNSEWHEKKSLRNLLEIAKGVSEQQIREREDFQKREREGSAISVLELLYPLLQGYDSVAVKSDVELGGTDQKFNLLMGRRVQRHFGMLEQDILTVPLIEGTDGARKMSKSYDNFIGLNDAPNEMFGKIMSVPDALLKKYFECLTDIEMPKNSPYESKMLLAETIAGTYHSAETAKKAKENFINVFSKKETPENIPDRKLENKNTTVMNMVTSTAYVSNSEARRLIEQGAVELDGRVLKDPNEKLELKGSEIEKVGKRKIFRIK